MATEVSIRNACIKAQIASNWILSFILRSESSRPHILEVPEGLMMVQSKTLKGLKRAFIRSCSVPIGYNDTNMNKKLLIFILCLSHIQMGYKENQRINFLTPVVPGSHSQIPDFQNHSYSSNSLHYHQTIHSLSYSNKSHARSILQCKRGSTLKKRLEQR